MTVDGETSISPIKFYEIHVNACKTARLLAGFLHIMADTLLFCHFLCARIEIDSCYKCCVAQYTCIVVVAQSSVERLP